MDMYNKTSFSFDIVEIIAELAENICSIGPFHPVYSIA